MAIAIIRFPMSCDISIENCYLSPKIKKSLFFNNVLIIYLTFEQNLNNLVV
jgi:hypothetical protein